MKQAETLQESFLREENEALTRDNELLTKQLDVLQYSVDSYKKLVNGLLEDEMRKTTD